MTQLSCYTDAESRLDRSFSYTASCCTSWCEACGRTYFVTSPGHGDYDEGELDELRANSLAEPDKYVEVPDFSSVSTMHFNGEQHVIGCSCRSLDQLVSFIEGNAEQLAAYLSLYWKDKRKEFAFQLSNADARAASLVDASDPEWQGWKPMSEVPKDASWVEVVVEDGGVHKVHWADGGGEDQPPFMGWFKENGGGPFSPFNETPLAWRPAKKGGE